MSYMVMIIYYIYSFLFIIVYIVCSIMYLLILYVGIGLIKDNKSYKLLLLIKMLSHVWQCNYEIDYVCPYKVL